MSRVKVTAAQAKAMGLPITSWKRTPEHRKAARKVEVDQHALFLAACNSWKLPNAIPEYQFHPERKWRADWAFADIDLLVEIEGGIWTEGRHTRGAGFTADLEKYKAAIVLGWFVLRVTPQQVESGEAFRWIKEIAESMGWEEGREKILADIINDMV
jgi:very-short-patch-repair endonuclease